jgi:hypothetical protein
MIGPAVTERVVKTFIRQDGERRIVILERPDGLFGFRQDRLVVTRLGEKWWLFLPYPTICGSAEIAEREARAQIPWLHLTAQ